MNMFKDKNVIAFLHVNNHPIIKDKIPIFEGENIIGRVPQKSNILIKDGQISSAHAKIIITEQKIILTDIGSKNGTFVSPNLRQRLEKGAPAEIQEGQAFLLGEVQCVIQRTLTTKDLQSLKQNSKNNQSNKIGVLFQLEQSSRAQLKKNQKPVVEKSRNLFAQQNKKNQQKNIKIKKETVKVTHSESQVSSEDDLEVPKKKEYLDKKQLQMRNKAQKEKQEKQKLMKQKKQQNQKKSKEREKVSKKQRQQLKKKQEQEKLKKQKEELKRKEEQKKYLQEQQQRIKKQKQAKKKEETKKLKQNMKKKQDKNQQTEIDEQEEQRQKEKQKKVKGNVKSKNTKPSSKSRDEKKNSRQKVQIQNKRTSNESEQKQQQRVIKKNRQQKKEQKPNSKDKKNQKKGSKKSVQKSREQQRSEERNRSTSRETKKEKGTKTRKRLPKNYKDDDGSDEESKVYRTRRRLLKVTKFMISGDPISFKTHPMLKLVKDIDEDFDVLVMDSFKRTFKFLFAIVRGIPIVNKAWLIDSEHFKKVMQIDYYWLTHPENRDLIKQSVQKTKAGFKLLNDMKFYIASDDSKLTIPFESLQRLIYAAGGQVLRSFKSLKSNRNLCKEVIVLLAENYDEEEIQQARQINKDNIYLVELLLQGFMVQQLDMKKYKLKV